MATLAPFASPSRLAARSLLKSTWIAALLLPAAALAERGQWTPLYNLGGEAIHLALVPDPDTSFPNHHSRLLWWQKGEVNQNPGVGNVLRWPRPNGEDCASFPSLPALGWSPGANIFCGGQAQLGDGRLLTVGGTDSQRQWGINDARTYDPAAGAWSTCHAMGFQRYYPTATVLRDGRVLVTSGNRGEQLWAYGGRRDNSGPSSPAGYLLERFGRSTNNVAGVPDGNWEPSVTPDADGATRPGPAVGHTVALLADPLSSDPLHPDLAQFFFGGRDALGVPVSNDVWVLRRENNSSLTADYSYKWKRLVPGTPAPDPRSEHTAVARSSAEMYVFGGLRQVSNVDTPTNELWRLYRDGGTPYAWHWERITAAGGPSARWGHAAVYQRATAQHGDRMLVFGGAEAAGATGTLADSRVWAFDFENRIWSEVMVRDDLYSRRPLPRRDHVMVSDWETGLVVMYSGYLGPSTSSDSLWELDTESPEPPIWRYLETVATSPGPRAGHSATYDDQISPGEGQATLPPSRRRLYIFGGDIASSNPVQPADKIVYMVEPFNGTRTWYASHEAPFALSGHTAAIDPYGLVFARVPEIYDPSADAWSAQPSASWLQSYYPPTFLVPGSPTGGGRVVAVGQDQQARYLDIPASGSPVGWQNVGVGASGVSGFSASTGVMYEPGKILIAGGLLSGSVVGTSQTLDAHSILNGWQSTGSPVGMAPRLQHNLVLLPTGEVLAVGGVTGTALDNPNGVNCPQIWSPLTGSWTPPGDLACDVIGASPVVRNYHSTALLLPDARVISAGGFGSNPNRNYARIFCPPYLFKPSNPSQFAPRPVITSAPGNLAWGQVFTVCTPNPAAVQKVCLIRAPATTHTFDENQRYVPLTIMGRNSSPPRLFVAAPANRDDAPPGDYLMFLVGSSDGSSSYPEAPSIAEWVRLQAPDGADVCDAVAPGAISVEPDVVGPNSVLLTWSASADDAVIPESGAAKRFDLRKSLFPITSESGWAYAGPGPGAPTPGPVGTVHSLTVSDLFACTTYHFSLRAEDDKPNLAALPPDLAVTTTCGGGGSGGFSAHAASDDEEVSGRTLTAGGPRQATAQTSSATAPATLVVETHAGNAGAWQVSLRLATSADGPALSSSAVSVQQVAATGERDTLGQFDPGESQSILGLCALRERGRVAIPGFLGLDHVLTCLRSSSQDYTLLSAQHSRLGPMGADFLTLGGAAELLAGDVLDLTYAPAPDRLDNASAWYVLVRRQGTAPPTPFSRRPNVGDLPERFALYQNEPNPAGTATSIRFDLPRDGTIRLEVFDLLGRRVATVAEGYYPAGRYTRSWDLRDAGGERVRPGVYVCRYASGEFRALRKVGVVP
jgi:hypothetical protein